MLLPTVCCDGRVLSQGIRCEPGLPLRLKALFHTQLLIACGENTKTVWQTPLRGYLPAVQLAVIIYFHSANLDVRNSNCDLPSLVGV
eukprot:4985180-Amphidinium_carterae.1